MPNALGWILILALGAFCIYEIVGIFRDRAKRKAVKANEDQKAEEQKNENDDAR